MFNHNHYVPVLKWKRGERTALENLNPSLKEHLTPLIEIQPVPFDHQNEMFSKSLDEHLIKVGEEVKIAWNNKKSVFVDIDTLYHNEDFSDETLESGEHPLEFVIKAIEENETSVIPVTGIYRTDAFHSAVKDVYNIYKRGVCIRLEESDLSDLNKLQQDLDSLMAYLSIEAANVDIILDYKQILPPKKDEHTNNLILTLARFPQLKMWRTLTLISTAYPKTLQQIPTSSNGSLPRTEWSIYNTLRDLELPRIPSFGDYTITNPDFVNINPRFLTIAAGVRYTTQSEFLIFRGRSVKNNGFKQMVQICKDVVAHPGYYGPDFSQGDKNIFDCSNEDTTTGSAEKWVTAGINHHLTVVAYAFSTQFAVSTADLP